MVTTCKGTELGLYTRLARHFSAQKHQENFLSFVILPDEVASLGKTFRKA